MHRRQDGWCNFLPLRHMSDARWPTCSLTRSCRARAADAPAANAPLADRLRPQSLDEVVGQEHLTGPDGAIGRMVAAGKLSLDDPVGAARHRQDQHRAAARRRGRPALRRRSRRCSPASPTSRRSSPRRRPPPGPASGPCCSWTRSTASTASQQDGFLPYVEDGTVTLVGATTENPSFELNAALLSRCQVLILRRLDEQALAN